MAYRTQQYILSVAPNGSFVSGQVNRVEVLGDGRELPAMPRSLDADDVTGVLNGLNISLMTERDTLQVQLNATNDLLADALGALEPLQQTNTQLQAQVEALQAELDAIRNPPGLDLSTREGVREYIRQERYTHRIAGISIEGVVFTTIVNDNGDDATAFSVLATNAIQWLTGDAALRALKPDGMFTYTSRNGRPVRLHASQVLRAYRCMLWYIDECFNVEYTLCEELYQDASDLEVVKAKTDLPESWPTRVFTWEEPT